MYVSIYLRTYRTYFSHGLTHGLFFDSVNSNKHLLQHPIILQVRKYQRNPHFIS